MRAEMEEMAKVHAEILSDLVEGTTEKAETRVYRGQAARARLETKRAKKAQEAADTVANEATAARQAESLKRVAAQRELVRLRSEQERMMEEPVEEREGRLSSRSWATWRRSWRRRGSNMALVLALL